MHLRSTIVALATIALTLVGCNLLGSSSSSPDDKHTADSSESASEGDWIEWSDPIEVATGSAYRGPWRMNDSDFHYVDDPDVTVASDDTTGVVWVDNERQDVFFQTFDADGTPGFDEPTDVSSTPDVFSWLPRVAFADDDPKTVYVLWQEIAFTGGSHGGEILFARSTDGGQSFDEAINLSNTTAGAGKGRTSPQRWNNGSLDMAIGSGGTVYAAWTEYEGALRASHSTDGGDSFSEPVHLAGSPDRPARGPSLAIADDETVYVAWTFGEQPDADVHIARSTDGGDSFDDGRPVVSTDGHADAPALAIDGDDTFHLAIANSPRGIDQRYAILYARSTDELDGFETVESLSPTTNDRADSARFPSLAVDDGGNPHVLWEYYPDYQHRPVGLKLSVSDDGGDSFYSPAIIDHSADPDYGISGGLQGLLMDKIDIAGDDTLHVVHSRFLSGEASHVHLFRGNLVP